MNDGSGKRDHRRTALVGLRSDPEHCGCDIVTRGMRDMDRRCPQVGDNLPIDQLYHINWERPFG